MLVPTAASAEYTSTRRGSRDPETLRAAGDALAYAEPVLDGFAPVSA